MIRLVGGRDGEAVPQLSRAEPGHGPASCPGSQSAEEKPEKQQQFLTPSVSEVLLTCSNLSNDQMTTSPLNDLCGFFRRLN